VINQVVFRFVVLVKTRLPEDKNEESIRKANRKNRESLPLIDRSLFAWSNELTTYSVVIGCTAGHQQIGVNQPLRGELKTADTYVSVGIATSQYHTP
jgi:hypothetical protein